MDQNYEFFDIYFLFDQKICWIFLLNLLFLSQSNPKLALIIKNTKN